jgi:hypothetical protein
VTDAPAGFTLDPPLTPIAPPGFKLDSGAPDAPINGEIADMVTHQSGAGRVLDAFGQGLKNGWGADKFGMSDETAKWASDVGLINDPTKGGPRSILKGFNEGLMRSTAFAYDAVTRGGNALYHGIGDTAIAVGVPRDIVGMPEAFMGDAHFMPRAKGAPHELAQGRDLGVVGEPSAAPGEVGPSLPSEAPDVKAPNTAPAEAPHPIEMAAQAPSAESSIRVASPAEAASMGPQDMIHGPLPDKGNIIDKAGNIRLDNAPWSDGAKEVIRQIADEAGGSDAFMESRRGVQSLAMREQLAEAAGIDAQTLLDRKTGDAFNDYQIAGVTKAFVQSANDTFDAMRKAGADGASDADIERYAELRLRHQSLQEQFSGATAEAGRALNALKKAKDETAEAQSLSEHLKNTTGLTKEELVNEAKTGSGLNSPQGISQFLNNARRPTFKDQFVEYYVNGLLSGPMTHASYAESNALLSFWKSAVETPVAGAIGAARQAVTGTTDRVYMGEAAARVYGFGQGSIEGIKAGYEALKSGVTTALPGEVQMPKLQPKIPGVAGQIVTAPSRVIAAIHSYGRAIGYRQEINALAYRDAAAKGLAGDDFSTHMAQLKANPTEDMVTNAAAEATSNMMMGLPGTFGKRLEALTKADTYPGVAAKVVMPFVRVGANIVNHAFLERTPLGVLSQDIRDNLMNRNGAAARDTQVARMMVGSSIAGGAVWLVNQGLVTGGGPNTPGKPEERAVWMLDHQPYSFKMFGQWHSYARFGSLAMLFGTAANFAEIHNHLESHEKDNVALMITEAASHAILNETWMRGLSDTVKALTEPGRYGARYLANEVATIGVPFSVGLSQIARAMDPQLRNAQGIIDTAKSRVPVLSQTLMPRLDIWGRPMVNGGLTADGAFGAMYQKNAQEDPVNRELLRLNIYPAPVEQKIKGVQLTPDQYFQYQQRAGQLSKMALDSLVNQPSWSKMPDFAQREMIERTMKNTRTTAEAMMQMSNRDLVLQGIQQRLKQISGVAK